VDVHRSGPLVGCKADPDVQMEITYGPFTYYVRCVRRPPRLQTSTNWGHLRPDRWLVVAAMLSLAAHTVAMAIPVEPLPVVSFRAGPADAFVDVVVQRSIVKFELREPTPPKPMPNLSVQPPKVETALERVEGRDTEPVNKRRRKPRPPPPENLETKPETDAREELKSVSVSDFHVAGMIPHLPAVKIDARTGPIIRSGSSILRGDATRGYGVLTKSGMMALRPRGRLSEKTITRVVNQHAAEIERCYLTSLRRQPGLRGRVEVEWIVDRIGVVKTVIITYDDVGSPAIARCVRASIRTWVFPPPDGGTASVAFPFVFSNLRH
ncbi:MAG: AgmX/PglI C-terminal domain-containing protein, partial [Myxococcota bacterium]